MKKTLTLFLIIFPILLSSCKSEEQSEERTGMKFVGEWYSENSKMIGGYKISYDSRLSINSDEKGNYNYKFKNTITDYMYGGEPKTEYSEGRLDSILTDEFKWKFISGNNLKERGGYIYISSFFNDDYPGDKKPDELSVFFNEGRGDVMKFTRLK